MKQVRMRYSAYKSHYSDCNTVPGTYDEGSKTIEVLIPEGREKPSGVRGQKFHRYKLWFIDRYGKLRYCKYKAVSLDNALKQYAKDCKREGWKPCDDPESAQSLQYRLELPINK